MEEKVNTDYDTLRGLTKLIKSKDIRKFVEDFFDNEVPSYFKTVPASSSGKYHPPYALGDGGLVRHTIAAVKFMVHISELEYLQINSIMRDRMIAAVMMHDTFKQGKTGGTGHTTKDHAREASQEIFKVASMPSANKEIEADCKIIARLVSTHMGEWTPKCKPGNRYEFLVHLADFLASRKDILVDFNLPTEIRKK